MADFFIGLDLGQAQDYTAISVVEKLKVPTGEKRVAWAGIGGGLYGPGRRSLREVDKTVTHYHLRCLERPRLGTPYPAIVERVGKLMGNEPLKGKTHLVVDSTGVGAPVVDLLEQAGLHPVAVTITGGDSVSRDGDHYSVPKRDLVSTLQVLFQGGRLKIAEGLPEAGTLVQELLSFRVKIDLKSAHDAYEPWREGIHDDLVLAVALACWYGENQVVPNIRFF
ncbi:MAG: hypothetical protein DDT21_02620 [Syntrophomonadaceae bacterium]|nr:hypothetical protein [Bacillota bacterium]